MIPDEDSFYTIAYIVIWIEGISNNAKITYKASAANHDKGRKEEILQWPRYPWSSYGYITIIYSKR